MRVTSAWPSPSNGLMHTRPWRSSPLAGPVLSTLPPVIPEAPEESYENDLDGPDTAQGLPRVRPPSSSTIASQTGSLSASASGYGSRNASGSASALALADGEASTSSVSLVASTNANGTSSSQGHSSSQSHSVRPVRLTKPYGRRPSSSQGDLTPSKKTSIAPPPRARTLSHGNSRSASFSVRPLALSPTIPQAYSRSSPRPTSPDSDANNAKQPPSNSRDPDSNWMSSSPFGPAQTPKFSRLAMASPAVVMPLSAKEYRKRKAKEFLGKGKDKDAPTSSNRVTFIDNAISALQSSNGVPAVKVSPPPSGDVHPAPSSPGDHTSDRRTQPQPQVDHPPFPQTSMSPRPSSSKQKRPRSRPNTPPRPSPLAAHPPISPKSSAGTFYSFVSTSDDDTPRPQGLDDSNVVPSARPRPRRRKSHPDRLSNGARLSLLEAMNRLSQEDASLNRLSVISPTDGKRFSVASQASGHTLFYDVEPEGEQGQATGVDGEGNGDPSKDEDGPRTPVLHTQSLEDLSSTLTRTGIEVAKPNGDEILSEDGRKAKRNVRTVRISDTVEVSPPPVTRRRKLTKRGLGSARASTPVVGTEPAPVRIVKETTVPTQTQPQRQTQERRTSLLPWKSKGSSDRKGVAGVSSVVAAGESTALTPTKGLVHPNESTAPAPVSPSPSPIPNRSSHVDSLPKPKSNATPPKRTILDTPASTPTPTTVPSPEPESFRSSSPPKGRRYTFSFLSSPTFRRPKREKSNTAPPRVEQGPVQSPKGIFKGSVVSIERTRTDSTSTSICTITQGSQSTLVPSSPVVYDLTTLASSGGLSGSMRGSKSSVPMLRRLNAQEVTIEGVPPQSEWEGRDDSTPSLITNGSTETTSSSPRTPSYPRIVGAGESFVPRPSGLKESYIDTFEEDSEDSSEGGRTSRCMHRKPEPGPLARSGTGWGDISEEDERHLRPNPRPGSRPGTASSTLTTATETSGSYLSFSTIPASTTSSDLTSRSESPSPVGGNKRDRDRAVSVAQSDSDGGEDVHMCTSCGHRPMSPVSSHSFSPSLVYDPDLEGMHPMFTVPLVTVPVSALGMYLTPAKANQAQSSNHVHFNAVTTTTTVAIATNDMVITTPSSMPPPQQVKKRHRPQTAPVDMGDAALKFIEEAKAMRAREGGVDLDALIRSDRDRDRPTKPKAGESKFKVALKGLLKWNA